MQMQEYACQVKRVYTKNEKVRTHAEDVHKVLARILHFNRRTNDMHTLSLAHSHSSLKSPENTSAEKETSKKQNICVHIHEYVFLNDCLRSESESASQHSSPPQLKGV